MKKRRHDVVKRQKPDTIKEMRETLEGLPSPFYTKNISDQTIQDIIATVGGYPYTDIIGDPENDYAYNKACEQWWIDLEDAANYYGIPYYEDLED
jgi:hypothetical protein